MNCRCRCCHLYCVNSCSNSSTDWHQPLPHKPQLLACRKLTSLCINAGDTIEELPCLPPQLQHLDLSHCYMLRALPALPPTLRHLDCSNCGQLQGLPQLPESLTWLHVTECYKLQQLPALPEGLQRLTADMCEALTAVSSSC